MKIILNILTHGDEKIGLKVAGEIRKLGVNENTLTVQVANREAFDSGKRFIDQDLNRSFPGKKDGNHEERLAYKLSPAIKLADIVIDIHSTTSELKDAIIITKLDLDTFKCVEAMRPKYVLAMNVTKGNALISQAKIGIAFEYGKDGDPRTLAKIVRDIKRLLRHLGVCDMPISESKTATRYFDVFSGANKPKGYKLLKKVENYKLIRKGEAFAAKEKELLVADEDFYPILFGDKNYKDIFGFKAKMIKKPF